MDKKALWEKRMAAVTAMRALHEKCVAEKRDMTSEEQESFDKMETEIRCIETSIQRAESLERAESVAPPTLGAVVGARALGAGVEGEAAGSVRTGLPTDIMGNRATAEYAEAFTRMISRGREGLTPEHRAALAIDSDLGGGIFAASERFIARLIKNADDLIPLRQFCTVIPCAYGESLGMPSLDGDIGEFEFGTGETAASVEDTGLAFGKRELKPHPIKRKTVKISKALIESPRIDVEGVVVQRAGVALNKALGRAYMTGDGSLRPLGLFTASNDGIPTSRDVSTGNTATAIKPDNLVDVQGTLKSAYSRNARWLFHPDAITKLRKEKIADGQYLWQPGLQMGQPDLILGKPYILDDLCPKTFTTGQYVGMYGDFSYYYIADAVSMTVQRLLELYAPNGQIGLLFDKMAADGMPILSEAFVRIKLG